MKNFLLKILTNNYMTHIEKRLNDVRYKIRSVQENRNNHFRCPREIITTLSLIEIELMDNLEFMKAKTDFSF